ncbi:MAG: ABC transporter substrate-binding protein [Candidatus Egerieousia sp.]
MKFFVILCALGLLLTSCGADVSVYEGSGDGVEYAKYLRISGDTITSINVGGVTNSSEERYLLVPRDCTDILKKNPFAIPVPVKSCVAMSTTYLPHLKALGEMNAVTAISGTAFVYDKDFNKLISERKIEDVGSETSPDYERIVALAPDVVLAYGVSGSDNSYIQKLRRLGVRVVVINDYLESVPLAKVEYIKLFGALTQKRESADSIFTSKVANYNAIKRLVEKELDFDSKAASERKQAHQEGEAAQSGDSKRRIKVLINLPYKDIWYLPGGENYTSVLVRDAGGEIIGAKIGETVSSQESFERIYLLGKNADVWINLNSIKSRSELSAQNPMYKNFPAFKAGMLFNNTKRVSDAGGCDFWESGALNPDEILKDLITIFHPDIAERHFPSREMMYYFRLK